MVWVSAAAVTVGCGIEDDDELVEVSDTEQAVFSSRSVGSMVAIGDSLTAAFNAQYGSYDECRYTDTKDYSYAANVSANNGTLSIVERASAANATSIPVWNVGEDGAKMKDGDSQALKIKTWALSQPSPRLVTIFLGHNDICGTGGEHNKVNTSCSNSTQNPNNYCRTSAFYYEQQFRQMLDVLITIPNARVGIINPVSVSQLCNHRNATVVDYFFDEIKCKDLYATVEMFDDAGVCKSLTYDCSDARIADAYTTWSQYKSINARVGAEYHARAAGTIPINTTFGTGGVVKASGVSVQVTNAVGQGKLNYKNAAGNVLLSKCDCFHATRAGQDYIADLVWNGLTCSAATPCCDDALNSTSLLKGKCTYVKTDGSRVPGLW
jgi:lysophospholipase L1-like esterase